MERSENIDKIAPALVKAQAKIGAAKKDHVNPFFKAPGKPEGSRYADLGSVMEACKAALNDNGISVLQPFAASEPGTLALDTVLMHESGQWFSGRTVMPLAKHDAQGFGSAATYCRRYSLASMVGVVSEDDDGNGASGRGNAQPPARQPQRQQAPPKQDALEDVKFFKGEMHKAFLSRAFETADEKKAVAAILKAHDADSLEKLTLGQRHAVIGNIGAGKADKFKRTKEEAQKAAAEPESVPASA